ncbi:Uncharacterised protein [Mycobacterium tuberculosis]|uniref:Uncharacterized protein n=1 Tax=Mycobacterium tuberculosis TaxID=1773 RepID=A0A654U943_MYCTX|nr:Uncharacterised protein [Mycobacterium tuberculosis]
MRADTNGPVASGDLVDLADGGDGHSRIGAEGDCGGHGLGGVAAIHRAWQCQPHRQRQPVGPIQRGVVEPPVRGGPLEVGAGGVPVVFLRGGLANDDLAAARAADRIV